MNQRYLCVYLPMWSIHLATKAAERDTKDRSSPTPSKNHATQHNTLPPFDDCTLPAHVPLVLHQIPLHKSEKATLVVHSCECLQKKGIYYGISLALAKMRAPLTTAYRQFCPEQDVKFLCRLAAWAMRFSPLVALDEELVRAYRSQQLTLLTPQNFGFTINITGTQRIHGDESHIIEKLLYYFSRRKIRARISISSTFGSAWALSRFGSSTITISPLSSSSSSSSSSPQEELQQALGELPIEALRIPFQTARILKLMGITHYHHLLRIPQKQLIRHFKEAHLYEGLLSRLRQTLGTEREILQYIKPKTHLTVSRQFETPLSNRETVKKLLRELVAQLVGLLVSQGKTTRSFLILLSSRNFDSTTTTYQKEVTLCHATKSAHHAIQILEPLFDSFQSQEGISRMQISARLTARNGYHQTTLEGEGSAVHETEELLNHLSTRLGPASLRRIEFRGSYLPENSFSYATVSSGSPRVDIEPPYYDRPSRLFENPLKIGAIAMLPDKPPSLIIWNGEKLPIVKGQGPERICYEWWNTLHLPDPSALISRDALAARDYFKIQDSQGRWLWLYRDTTSMEWFIHGIWS